MSLLWKKTWVKPVQFWKLFAPTVFTVSGSVSDFSCALPAKAPAAMDTAVYFMPDAVARSGFDSVILAPSPAEAGSKVRPVISTLPSLTTLPDQV